MTALLVSLRFAEAPALPLHTAGPYVAAAYMVFILILLIYVGIMATRLVRSQRELLNLRAQLEERDARAPDDSENENESDSHSHATVGGDIGDGGVDVT